VHFPLRYSVSIHPSPFKILSQEEFFFVPGIKQRKGGAWSMEPRKDSFKENYGNQQSYFSFFS
jgi:hypothetical protein